MAQRQVVRSKPKDADATALGGGIRRYPPATPIPERREFLGVRCDHRHPVPVLGLALGHLLDIAFGATDDRPGAMGHVDDVHMWRLRSLVDPVPPLRQVDGRGQS